MLASLYASGHAVDIVLAIIAGEFVWLTIRGGWPTGAAMLRLLPGVFMLVALRNALTGTGWIAVMLPLAASFPAHLADLLRSRPAGRDA